MKRIKVSSAGSRQGGQGQVGAGAGGGCRDSQGAGKGSWGGRWGLKFLRRLESTGKVRPAT